MNYTYILLCGDGTLYTGWTNHLEERVRAHNEGRGAKYTRGRTPVKLYDADREKPVLLEAGQYIRFRSVSEDEYHEIEKQAESGKYSCAVYEKEA